MYTHVQKEAGRDKEVGEFNWRRAACGAQEVAESLLGLCEGSVLALAVIGNHLRGKASPQDWEDVQQTLTQRLQDPHRLPDDYPLTVFEALDLVLDGLSDDERNVVMAFWQFRPGAVLPLPLVKLAVEVETRREWDSASLEFSLEKIVRANLLELCDEAAYVAAAGRKKGYRLLNLVAMWLTAKNKHRIQQPFFQGRGHQAHTTGQAASAAEERRQEQCSLLAAFLGTYGKVEGSLNVPQQAEHFLDAALGLGFRGWADPNLSSTLQAAKLACKIQEGLSAEAVIAAILAWRGFLKRPADDALQDLDQAHRLQPNNADSLRQCGATKMVMGRHEEALQDLDQADLKDAFTLTMRGAVKWKRGQLPAALRDFEEALRLGGEDDGDVLTIRAAVKLEGGDPEGARQDALRAWEGFSGLPLHRQLAGSPALCQDVLRRCGGDGDLPLSSVRQLAWIGFPSQKSGSWWKCFPAHCHPHVPGGKTYWRKIGDCIYRGEGGTAMVSAHKDAALPPD
eukprot:jgi/Botrbrau1/20069/Bobra.200_1s0073.1